MSWTIWTHPMPTDTFEEEMVIDGGFTIINPNSDGNYDAVVSFQMLEEWLNRIKLKILENLLDH